MNTCLDGPVAHEDRIDLNLEHRKEVILYETLTQLFPKFTHRHAPEEVAKGYETCRTQCNKF